MSIAQLRSSQVSIGEKYAVATPTPAFTLQGSFQNVATRRNRCTIFAISMSKKRLRLREGLTQGTDNKQRE